VSCALTFMQDREMTATAMRKLRLRLRFCGSTTLITCLQQLIC